MGVRPEFIAWIPKLLLLNERVVYLGDYHDGFLSQTMIGATNVGSIEIYCDKNLKTNKTSDDYTFRMWKEKLTSNFDKGDAFGEFKMGSCIVLIFEAPANFRFVHRSTDQIRVGQRL